VLKSFLIKIIPKFSRKMLIPKWEDLVYKRYLRKIKENIFDYYKNKKSLTEDHSDVPDYLKVNAMFDFQYAFTEKYQGEDIAIYNEKSNGLKYVLHNFFRKANTSTLFSKCANTIQ